MDRCVLKADCWQFVKAASVKAGVEAEEAGVLADVLVWNDLVGRMTQGAARLEIYLRRVMRGLIRSPVTAVPFQRSHTTAILDGQGGLGPVNARKAMNHAITLAQEHGIGIVGVNNSNHFGTAAYFINMATQANMLGFAFSNATPKVTHPHGKTPFIGTNPLGFGAPMANGRSLLVDMATSASAGSTIRQKIEIHENLPPATVRSIDVSDKIKHETASPVLLPAAGGKGLALGMMVEILSGVITGSSISHQVGSLYHSWDKSLNTGHLFMAVAIEPFLPLTAYFERMAYLIDMLKTVEPLTPEAELLYPGEKRWQLYEENTKSGIPFTNKTIDQLNQLAIELDIQPL
ncbi:MAG: Ldh family oxidoreductase [Candidatus Promineifilaceae bacterium]